MDILWPRWVARIGVTRATEACFLAADRQCTELPLLRLPRLVPEVVGCDPFVPRDLARVGWRGLAPFLPIGPRERPRLADSFFAPGSGARGIPRVARPAIRRVAAMRGKERGPRGTPPSGPLRGGKGIVGSPRAPQFGPPALHHVGWCVLSCGSVCRSCVTVIARLASTHTALVSQPLVGPCFAFPSIFLVSRGSRGGYPLAALGQRPAVFLFLGAHTYYLKE